MLKATMINLINEHRVACGRKPIEDHPNVESELERIEAEAQYGDDPFAHEPDDTFITDHLGGWGALPAPQRNHPL